MLFYTTYFNINHDKKGIVVLGLAGNLIPSFVMFYTTYFSINHDKKCIVVLELAGNLIPSFVMSTYWSLLKANEKVFAYTEVASFGNVSITDERECGGAVNGVLSRWQ